MLVRNKKTIAIYLFLLGGIILASFVMFSRIKKRIQSAEVKSALRIYSIAQRAYHKEYKEFAIDKNKLGYFSDSERVKVYLSNNEIPQSIRTQISSPAIPYVTKVSFKILGLQSTSEEDFEVWTINNSGEMVNHGNVTNLGKPIEETKLTSYLQKKLGCRRDLNEFFCAKENFKVLVLSDKTIFFEQITKTPNGRSDLWESMIKGKVYDIINIYPDSLSSKENVIEKTLLEAKKKKEKRKIALCLRPIDFGCAFHVEISPEKDLGKMVFSNVLRKY